jgi:hypothetical protein
MTLTSSPGRIASALMLASVCSVAQDSAPPPSALGGWVNTADFGASGSKAETVATTVAGSKEITVAEVGDFKPGQGVTVSRANVRFVSPLIWGPTEPYSTCKPMKDAIEMRGYDGSTGSWFVYLLEIDGKEPLTFRWSHDLVHDYKWTATKVPITWDWQKLSNGLEVKFNQRDLELGHMLTFGARDQLETVIEKIEGKTLTLRAAANRSASDAVVRHDDTTALQTAIDTAIKGKRNVFFPAGWYRLSRSLQVSTDAIFLEGVNGVDTVMDITYGIGSVFHIYDTLNATVRNFRMVGHTSMDEAAGSFTTSSGFGFWACALKGCNALGMERNENLWIENVHASHMASEAFYSSGTNRLSTKEQPRYQKSLVYLRCSVTDCAANAFNNNDVGENTSVLYCRIDGAGWHAAEMPARFLKLVGNYVRNAGAFTVGDMSHRADDLHALGCGQAIVVDNVFEGIGKSGGIAVNHGSSQVVIANNLFINFNGPAITASSQTVRTSFPSNTVTISGNIIDLTYGGENPASRAGITVSASNVIVADNQIYVRGKVDPRVTGIVIAEPALNVNVHGNLVRNCQQGLVTRRAGSRVTQVIDATTFLENGLPLEWKNSHLYRGWNLAWTGGSQPNTLSVLDAFDPETLRFKLKEAREMKVGDTFQVFPAGPANWTIHSNTISGCADPVKLDSYGSETSFFRDNIVSRGEAQGVKQAIQVVGQFKLIGNTIFGFDETGSSALLLTPDPVGRVARNFVRNNIFNQCAAVVKEAREGLWKACLTDGNLFVNCQTAPSSGGTVVKREQTEPVFLPPPPKPTLSAPKLAKPATVDGVVDEWPWQDTSRAIALAQSPTGDPMPPQGYACAAWDDTSLYLALRFVLPKGATAVGGGGWGVGDGIEVSFQDGGPKAAGPIYLLWGDAAGRFEGGPYGGATPAQIETLQKGVSYAAKPSAGGWSCEWKIPFAAAGLDPATARKLRLNLVAHLAAGDGWTTWTTTGGALYQVASAGELILLP